MGTSCDKKKYKLILGFVIFVLSQNLSAQFPEYELLFSHEIESRLASGKLHASSAAYNYTYIGDYHRAIGLYDIPVSWGLDTLSLPKEYKLVDAKTSILREAASHQIVIISESHLKPQHRIFSKQLIVGLKKLGFSILGMETLTQLPQNSGELVDAALQERGYALNSPATGTYTQEPHMADLLRVAIANDYTIFPYERAGKIEGKDRDEIQAMNIIKILEKNPAAKIIIHCGWHHAIESNMPKRGKSHWMAHCIKKMTGINPLTIYQDNFTEKVLFEEHPSLKQVDIQKPSVFVNKKEEVMPFSEHVDIEVVHPKTNYVKGRPDWLKQDETYIYHQIDKKKNELGYPVFVMAYLPGEEEDGVPIDLVELKHKYDDKYLVLKKGNYKLIYTNKKERQAFDLDLSKNE